MDASEQTRALIDEYHWLWHLEKTLYWQADQIDARLVEIERKLPDEYTFPGDPPSRLTRSQRRRRSDRPPSPLAPG